MADPGAHAFISTHGEMLHGSCVKARLINSKQKEWDFGKFLRSFI